MCYSYSVAPPTPKLKRSTSRLLRRITSTTSFDMNVLTSTLRPRKRKRKDVDEDSMSVHSLNIAPHSQHELPSEKKSKRRSMAKMSSFVNMLSPATTKRTFSFKAPSTPAAGGHTPQRQITPYKKPKPASIDRRTSKLWSDTVDQAALSFSSNEIKRQEAIHELVQGEVDLIEDLRSVHKHYYYPMKKLKLMTEKELDSIFGIVERLVPFHEDLLSNLKALRKADGTIDGIGETLSKWVPNLRHYETYCANQVFAKGLLDTKKTDKKVDDFLTRCLESPFSRKLDLWNFLDLPRSRLVKYPILLKQIYKYTEDNHPDKEAITELIERVEAVIKDVDVKMGESVCKYTIQSLQYLYDTQKSLHIEQSKSVLCSGQLKNDRGTKLHVVLFDKVMVVTRTATRNNKLSYQIVKDPIPLSELELIDLSETENKKGSFKSKVLRHTSHDKCAFRVFSRANGHPHTLYARDEHDKRQWLSCIQNAVSQSASLMDKTQPIESVADNSETILPDSSNNVETCLEIEPTITRKQETVLLRAVDDSMSDVAALRNLVLTTRTATKMTTTTVAIPAQTNPVNVDTVTPEVDATKTSNGENLATEYKGKMTEI
ncbi:ARHGEF3 [Bugula neritina]|uniref:ARHGEF3 n=1 Tax=Bugula neritina TaxID=10212 RepID=A0A7J7J1R9_BUGNE|nr:ARHGEF3 [Bugula neritina]